jgi:hypothetical protein
MYEKDSFKDRLPATISPQPDTCRFEIPTVFFFLFQPARGKVASRCRDSAKGRPLAEVLLILVAQSPLRSFSTREFQSSIADSVEMVLNDQIAPVGPSEVYLLPQKNTQEGILLQFNPAGLLLGAEFCLIFTCLPLTVWKA